MTIVHRVAGGSPPFQITLYAGNTSTVLGSASGVVTDYPSSGAIMQPFRAVITDANGCVQTVHCVAYASLPVTAAPVPTVVPVDPETGIGGFSINPATVMPLPGCVWVRVQQNGNTLVPASTVGDVYALSPFTGLVSGTYTVQYSNQGCPDAGTGTWGMYDYFLAGSQPWATESRVSYCNAAHGVTIPAPPPDPNAVRLPIKVFLQGPYDQVTGMMGDALRTSNKLPWHVFNAFYLGEPLTQMNTLVNMDPASRAVTGADAYVDWVRVELRDALNPASIVYSRTALVQRDGDVVMQNGAGPLSCAIASGSYYVAIKHRNHLAVMTAAPVALGLATSMIDFTDPSTLTYGTSAQKQLGSKMVMWSGDATSDGALKYTGLNNDRDPILTAVGSTTPNGMVSNVYDHRDTNLDGLIKYTGLNNDRDIILTNVGSSTPNNTRLQQLP